MATTYVTAPCTYAIPVCQSGLGHARAGVARARRLKQAWWSGIREAEDPECRLELGDPALAVLRQLQPRDVKQR